jgi:hypothetical protein
MGGDDLISRLILFVVIAVLYPTNMSIYGRTCISNTKINITGWIWRVICWRPVRDFGSMFWMMIPPRFIGCDFSLRLKSRKDL